MSVYQLPDGGSSWDQLNAHTVMDLREDPFWGFKQGTSSPSHAILIEGGVGFLRRSVNGGQTWSDITPSTNPPNSGADSPIPTTLLVTYKVIDGSRVTPNTHGVLVTWQNASSDWRTWVLHTTDDFATSTWVYLGIESNCANTATMTDMPSTTNLGVVLNSQPIVQVDTNRYVCIFSDGGTTYLQAFEIDVSDVVTVGARIATNLFVATICKAGTNKVVLAQASAGNFGISDLHTAVCTVAPTTLTITQNAFQQHLSSVERLGAIFDGPSRGLRVICPDGTNIVVLTGAVYPLDPADSCNASSITGTHYLLGTVGATTVAFDTTTCDGDTVQDWQFVETYSNNIDVIHVYDCGDSSHFLYTIYGTGDDFAIGAGTTGTVDTATVLPSVSFPFDINNGSLCMMTTSLAVYCFDNSNFDDHSEIMGIVVTRTGTSVSFGSEQLIYSTGAGSNLFAWIPFCFSITSTTFGIRVQDIDPAEECSSLFRCLLTAGTITVLDTCIKYSATPVIRRWTMGYSTTHYVEPGRFASDFSTRDAAVQIDDVSPTCSLTGEALGLGLSYGRGVGGKAWATICDGTNLELIDVDISPLVVTARHTLGTATFANAIAKTWIAYPLVRWFNDDYVMIYGRMNDPQSLGNPSHLIYTTNGGGSFLLNESGFGADHIGAMIEDTANDLYVIRNTGGAPQLYEGTIVGSLSLTDTPTLTSDVMPHGIDLHWGTLAVVLASGSADAILVIAAVSPYTSWTDLTSDHGDASTVGLKSVEVL